MKKITYCFWSFILIICFSCNHSTFETENAIEKCTPYFTFDSVEHYYVRADTNKSTAIERRNNLSEVERKQLNMMYEDTAKVIADSIIYQNLEQINFIKVVVPSTKFDIINKIFCEKNLDSYESAACIPIYRDILIFKNKNKTVGFAKVCFQCGMSLIVGASEKTTMLYTHDDYTKLKEILYSK